MSKFIVFSYHRRESTIGAAKSDRMVWNDDAGISYPTSRIMMWWVCDLPS